MSDESQGDAPRGAALLTDPSGPVVQVFLTKDGKRGSGIGFAFENTSAGWTIVATVRHVAGAFELPFGLAVMNAGQQQFPCKAPILDPNEESDIAFLAIRTDGAFRRLIPLAQDHDAGDGTDLYAVNADVVERRPVVRLVTQEAVREKDFWILEKRSRRYELGLVRKDDPAGLAKSLADGWMRYHAFLMQVGPGSSGSPLVDSNMRAYGMLAGAVVDISAEGVPDRGGELVIARAVPMQDLAAARARVQGQLERLNVL